MQKQQYHITKLCICISNFTLGVINKSLIISDNPIIAIKLYLNNLSQ